jgi:hypothetical protein
MPVSSAPSSETPIAGRRQALAGEVVGDREDAEPTAIGAFLVEFSGIRSSVSTA